MLLFVNIKVFNFIGKSLYLPPPYSTSARAPLTYSYIANNVKNGGKNFV